MWSVSLELNAWRCKLPNKNMVLQMACGCQYSYAVAVPLVPAAHQRAVPCIRHAARLRHACCCRSIHCLLALQAQRYASLGPMQTFLAHILHRYNDSARHGGNVSASSLPDHTIFMSATEALGDAILRLERLFVPQTGYLGLSSAEFCRRVPWVPPCSRCMLQT